MNLPLPSSMILTLALLCVCTAAGAAGDSASLFSARECFFRSAGTTPPLVDVNTAKEDFIKVSGRNFVTSAGKPFIPIGYNHNPDWDKLKESNPLDASYDPAVTDRWMAHLKASGVNTLRLMLETPASGCLEKPIGTFVPETVCWLDGIVLAARRHGIRLMITPWDTFWMNRRWDVCPYNPALGGPVARPLDFLTKREVIEAQKKRLAFCIDRWGNTGTVFSWELMNEIDIWWGASPDQIRAWIEEMSTFVKDYETRRWGKRHMVGVSFAAPMPGGKQGGTAYHSPSLDYATTHLYIGVSKAPDEAIGPAETEAKGVAFALRKTQGLRPYLDSENGPIDHWIADDALDDAVFHNMTWAHLASGGAGSSMRWPYRHPHHLSGGMLRTLKGVSEFCGKVEWKRLSGPPAPLQVQASDTRVAFGVAGDGLAIVWTCTRDGYPADLRLSLNNTAALSSPKGMADLKVDWPGGPRRLSVRAYDTQKQTWLTPSQAEFPGTVRIPGAPGSLALILQQDGGAR